MSKAPPAWKLKKIYKCDVTLHKVTESEIVDEWGQTETSEETYAIKAEIQQVTLEEIAFVPAGQLKEGDCWGWFLPSYTIEGEDIEVESQDYVTFKSIKYLVQRIEGYYDGNTEVYRRALLRREIGQ